MMTWYQKHQQQVKSIMLGRELFVSILIYSQGERDVFNYKEIRKPAESILNGKKDTQFDLFPDSQIVKDTWKEATELRNNYAHAGMSSSPKSIDSLKQEIDGVIEEIKTCLEKFLAAASGRSKSSPSTAIAKDRSKSLPNTSIATARPNPRPKPPKKRSK